MLEYNFLKSINDYVRVYKELPLPAVIVDTAFKVYWSNNLAKAFFPHITNTKGLLHTLEEYGAEEISSKLQRGEGYNIKGVFPLGNVDMSFLPIVEDSVTVGIVILIMGAGTILDFRSYNQTSQTATALSNNIRESVGKVFSIMDSVAAKADLLNVEWVKANFHAIGLNNYHILRVAGNISEFAKYQSGGVQPDFKMINLFEYLRELKETISDLCRSMGVPLYFDIPNDDCCIQLDLKKFETAFFNILHNALYFTRPNNEVYVIAGREDESVTLTVHDKGRGIPAHVMPILYRPYMAYPAGGNSVGLGLTLTKIIVEAHGGRLEVASRENEGTSVTVFLPEKPFSKSVPLGQTMDNYEQGDRFSLLYVGLTDAALSPFREEPT